MRTRYRRILVAAGTALASMAILASAAQATKPVSPYEDFAGCPSRAEQPFIASCLKLVFSSGEIGFGNREVKITNPIVLRGGYEQETGNFLYNSEGGIIPARQTVPGGLIGLTGFKWLDAAVQNQNALKLSATVELAGQPGSVLEPTRILPIRLHLENQFLGNSCYVGSTAKPIVLNLTTGTTSPPAPNLPITGAKASPLEEEASRPEVQTTATPGLYVDNAYAVPAATGCQLTIGSVKLPIDEVVNSQYSLPSPAGKNTTALTFTRSVVSPDVIYP